MKRINILLLGGSKRIALAKSFKSLNKFFKAKINLFTYDIDPDVPFKKFGKVLIGKKWNDSKIFQDIRNKIKKYKLNIVIANTDDSTLILSKLVQKYENLKFISSGVRATKLCMDKIKMHEFLKKTDIDLIPIEKNRPPIFIKPIKGSASINSFKINNLKQLKVLKSYLNSKDYIFQKFISGTEYTVDVYINKNRHMVGCVSRKRLKTSHGESILTETSQNKKLSKIILKIIKHFNNELMGPLTFQFIKNKSKYYFLEINPRMSGGINASISSGMNACKYVIFDTLYNKKNSEV